MEQKQTFDFSIVKTLRMKRGMTAETLAQKANITRATIAKLESGQGNPTVETLSALGLVFQLGAGELVQMAENNTAESGTNTPYDNDGFTGYQVRFPGFELYFLKAAKGASTSSRPELHDHTAEVCLVISGELQITVRGNTRILGPGQAVRFKAIHEHELNARADVELILIHHTLA